MVQTRNIRSEEWVKVILGLAIFLGAIVRFFPGWVAGFPLNDGGMFLVMLRELKANHFLIPPLTSYNFSNIPYAYPPLGFYAGALISAIGIPDIQILRWLPVVVDILTIPAFFLLAETLLDDRPRAALGTVFFALTPLYGWEIMGGGLTRSFGALFMLLTLHFAMSTFKSGSWKSAWLASLFGGLSVLSHPQAGIHAAFGIAFFWFFTKHSWKKFRQTALLAILAAIISAPWWLTIYLQHGLAPFVSAAGSGLHDAFPLTLFFSDLFARDTFIPILMILRVMGMIWELSHRRFTLTLWAVLVYFLDQRSAGVTSLLAFSMLCATGLADTLPFAVRWLKKQAVVDFLQLRWLNVVIMGIMLYLFVECGFYSFVLVNTSLHTPEPFLAMQWAKANTPADSRFLLLTGDPGIMSDPIQEWFPALTERRSQTTMQGLEWTLNADFFPRLRSLVALQACTTMDCVNAWSVDTGLSYDYLLIQRSGATRLVLESFESSSNYFQVYGNSKILILQKK